MRKIEHKIINAVREGKSLQLTCRDKVEVYNGNVTVASVYLWDTEIFSVSKNNCAFSLHGYNTVTTKSRLNALLHYFVPNCNGIKTKNGNLFLIWNGKEYPIDVNTNFYSFNYPKNEWCGLTD